MFENCMLPDHNVILEEDEDAYMKRSTCSPTPKRWNYKKLQNIESNFSSFVEASDFYKDVKTDQGDNTISENTEKNLSLSLKNDEHKYKIDSPNVISQSKKSKFYLTLKN